MGVLSFWFWSLCFWNMSFFVFILDAIFCGTFFFSYFRTLCGWLSHLDVFFDVRFIISPGLAIVEEANLRCGDFLSENFVVTVLAVFLSFLSWLPDISSFHKFERQSCLFGVDNAFFTCWCYLGVLNNCFLFFFCGIMSFYVSISDVVFLVTSFSIFDHSVWLILSFRCAHF